MPSLSVCPEWSRRLLQIAGIVTVAVYIGRSLYAVYYDNEQTTEDITLYRFSSPETELQNATLNPDNSGFCTPANNCILGSGLINLTVCQNCGCLLPPPPTIPL